MKFGLYYGAHKMTALVEGDFCICQNLSNGYQGLFLWG